MKPELQANASKRDETHVKFTPWAKGKPASMLLNSIGHQTICFLIYYHDLFGTYLILQLNNCKVLFIRRKRHFILWKLYFWEKYFPLIQSNLQLAIKFV